MPRRCKKFGAVTIPGAFASRGLITGVKNGITSPGSYKNANRFREWRRLSKKAVQVISSQQTRKLKRASILGSLSVLSVLYGGGPNGGIV